MQLSQILVGTVFAATGFCAPAQSTPNFTPVALDEPLNWIGGPSLFPGNVIAGYSADMDKYDASSWADYCLTQCKGFSACTSSNSYSAINSGTPANRYWFCYVYRGGPTTENNYVRNVDQQVQDSAAYSIVA